MNYSSIEAKVVRGLDDAPVIAAQYLSCEIRPDVISLSYLFQDGEWVAREAEVSGYRLLSRQDADGNRAIGKNRHKRQWSSYGRMGLSQDTVPAWVWAVIERHRPQGAVTVPGV